MENIYQLVTARKSVRSYDGRPVSEADLARLQEYIDTIDNPYGIPVTFRLLDAKEHGLVSPVVSGTDLYIGAKLTWAPHAEEAYGYAFEKLVLFAQSMGLGTVWIGGTMNRAAFETAMALKAGEKMPCVTPIGYPAKKKSLRESMMRRGIKADSRKDFGELFFDGSFDTPLTPEKAGKLSRPLEAVRWAPSAVNRQPWRAVVTPDAVHFYEHRSGNFVHDATGDLQKIDLGIALCHFALSAKEEGLPVTFSLDDPGIPVGENTVYIASYRL